MQLHRDLCLELLTWFNTLEILNTFLTRAPHFHFAPGPINYLVAPGPFIKLSSTVPSVSCQKPDPYTLLCRENDAPSITDSLRRKQVFSPKGRNPQEKDTSVPRSQFVPEAESEIKTMEGSMLRPEPRTQEKAIWVLAPQHFSSVSLRSPSPSLSFSSLIWITHYLTQSAVINLKSSTIIRRKTARRWTEE